MPKTIIDIAKNKSPLMNPFQSFDYREFGCGCGAAFINIGFTYPIYKMIFRQVVATGCFDGFYNCVNNIYF